MQIIVHCNYIRLSYSEVMRVRFTTHAKEKIQLIQKYHFNVSEQTVISTIHTPIKSEIRSDGTIIVSSLLDLHHVLRVVYKKENDIIIVITCYPGRRKAYGI